MIEKLGGVQEEQMDTTTAAGAIAPAKLLKKKVKEEMNKMLEFVDNLTEEEAKIMLKVQKRK